MSHPAFLLPGARPWLIKGPGVKEDAPLLPTISTPAPAPGIPDHAPPAWPPLGFQTAAGARWLLRHNLPGLWLQTRTPVARPLDLTRLAARGLTPCVRLTLRQAADAAPGVHLIQASRGVWGWILAAHPALSLVDYAALYRHIRLAVSQVRLAPSLSPDSCADAPARAWWAALLPQLPAADFLAVPLAGWDALLPVVPLPYHSRPVLLTDAAPARAPADWLRLIQSRRQTWNRDHRPAIHSCVYHFNPDHADDLADLRQVITQLLPEGQTHVPHRHA